MVPSLEVLAAMPWFDNQRGSWCLLPSAPQIAQGELDHGASGSEYQRSGAFLLNSICGYAVGYCIVSDDICSGLRNAKQIIYCEEAPLCAAWKAPRIRFSYVSGHL
jgi:hypothetical protein